MIRNRKRRHRDTSLFSILINNEKVQEMISIQYLYTVAKPAGLFSPAIYSSLYLFIYLNNNWFPKIWKNVSKIPIAGQNREALLLHLLLIQYGLSIRKIIKNLSAQKMRVNLIFGAVLVPKAVSHDSGNSRLSVTSDWPISFSYPEPREWYWPIKSDAVTRAMRDGPGYENDLGLKTSLHSQFLLRFLVQFSLSERYELVFTQWQIRWSMDRKQVKQLKWQMYQRIDSLPSR